MDSGYRHGPFLEFRSYRRFLFRLASRVVIKVEAQLNAIYFRYVAIRIMPLGGGY